MEREALTIEVLSIAQAVKNSGGIVLVQVERVTTAHMLNPREVRIPGMLVDGVVVGPAARTIRRPSPRSTTPPTPARSATPLDGLPPLPTGPAQGHRPPRRAGPQTQRRGQPRHRHARGDGLGRHEEHVLDLITLTVEAGGIGGIPAGGLSFGAVTNPQAMIDQPYMFDFYDGGGLDQAFLGMAEVDADGQRQRQPVRAQAGRPRRVRQHQPERQGRLVHGDLHRRRHGRRSATGALRVVADTATRRFVRRLQQRTFSGAYARRRGQQVHYITERAVFRLTDAGLVLTEIAPGIDLERDVLAQMEFTPIIARDLHEMDPRIFRAEPMGLSRHSLGGPGRPPRAPRRGQRAVRQPRRPARRHHRATPRELATYLDGRLAGFGHRVHAVVNYDNVELGPAAEEMFFAMIRDNTEKYFLSATHYSTNAFFRHQLGQRFTQAQLGQTIYPSFAAARKEVVP